MCVMTADVGSVAVDEVHGYVYWSGNSKCTRAKLDGSAQEDIVTGKCISVTQLL